MPPSRVRIPPSPLRSTERCPSGLRSATGNRVRAERCVAGSNPALSVTRGGNHVSPTSPFLRRGDRCERYGVSVWDRNRGTETRSRVHEREARIAQGSLRSCASPLAARSCGVGRRRRALGTTPPLQRWLLSIPSARRRDRAHAGALTDNRVSVKKGARGGNMVSPALCGGGGFEPSSDPRARKGFETSRVTVNHAVSAICAQALHFVAPIWARKDAAT